MSLVALLRRLSWHPSGVTLLLEGEDRAGDLPEFEDGFVGLDGFDGLDILYHWFSFRSCP